ncbi:LacI family transcriptional regulator [Corynebacterium kutscheri]|uniref:LacI family transcriptional regulator n=1 Tax=Corynebacterium kutscheri TaxID=35755 RepID=A0A0F6QYT0_9CORY|nr:substrate-binding domain-containing protein [Corynebacterium kutscheri]AKE40762.1 transcriptional regulator, LacI family [Corynebacterium kutscheri]VEH04550.1 LacI family transcriptional regulator [Corynebacterium kutscheri]VEH11160.1 LacI family transcriptional regulator [Corynebacterium kutscheri]VEH80363.1 LacI family transcriptional regulator [Corynebacterium kutscheri]
MSKLQRRPSLAMVAEKLGVSRTTVSNAYNRPEQLSPALREKIFSTAEKLGYLGPDPAARSLRTRHVGAMGLLLTEHLTYAFEDAASVDFLSGVATASIGGNTSLTLIPVGPSHEDIVSARQRVYSAVVDGFIVYSVARQDPYLEAALSRKLPVVICDQPVDVDNVPFVGIDDRYAIAPVAQALVDAGHRRIGILCIRLDPTVNNGLVSPQRLEKARHHVQQARVSGALEVFMQAGLRCSDIPVIERHINDPINNVDAARELLEAYPDLTAVLCTTDTMAFGVLEYARQQGISIPEQLSVTGFDGVHRAQELRLTTVIQPNKAKGEAAWELLQATIRGEEPQSVLLETQFSAGATVTAPKN